MQRCGCCNRHLLTGETFRLYRRRLRGSVVVCSMCRVPALAKGWMPVVGPTYRQMTRRPRVLRARPVRRAVMGQGRVARTR
jgi:hypothetical protein